MLMYSLLMRNAEGPFYLNTLYDPCYVYLISSLNIAQFTSPVHFDHPGTPVQIIGAIVIKLTHLFKGSPFSVSEDVLTNPESYLDNIQISLVVINCAVLFFTALIIYRATGNLPAAFLIQLSPFLSYTVSYELSVVTAENFLISVVLLLTAYSLKFISDADSGKNKSYVIIFSLICGLGLAAKITFFPLVIIPLTLLNGLKKKIKFILVTFISFIIFILPAIGNAGYFINWVKSLVVYDEMYGKGKPDFVNPATFFYNLKEIFSDEIVFSVIYLLIFLTLLSVYFLKRKDINVKAASYFRLLISVFLAMTLQLIIVSKHYSGHYMVPALMMSATGIYLCIKVLSESFFLNFKKLNLNFIYSAIILIFSADILIGSYFNHKELESYKLEAFNTIEFIKKNKNDKIIVSSYGSSSMSYALAFTLTWSGSNKEKYQEIISKLYPDDLYFEFWRNDIFSASGKNNISKLIGSSDKMLFLNNYEDSNDLLLKDLRENYNCSKCTESKIYESPYGDKVYEITLR